MRLLIILPAVVTLFCLAGAEEAPTAAGQIPEENIIMTVRGIFEKL